MAPSWRDTLLGKLLQILLGVLAFCLGPADGSIHAQTNLAALPVVRFTVFAAEPIERLGYAPQAGAPLVPLQFYPTERSPRYEYRGRGPLQLVEIRSGDPVAAVVVPEGIREVLLLVSRLPRGVGSEGYQVAVLDDSRRQRAAGQIQILNLSGLDLTGDINGRRTSITSGLNPAVTAGRSARVTLRTVFRDRNYLSWHDTINLGASERALLILFPPFLPGSVEVQTRVLLDESSPDRVLGVP